VTAEASPPEPVTLTVDELAALLRCNRKTVYEAIQRGEIPGVRRIGNALRAHRPTVIAWLAEGQGRASRRRSR
jgi:excisionase family DNA binding protein